jgi:hypothetical protein
MSPSRPKDRGSMPTHTKFISDSVFDVAVARHEILNYSSICIQPKNEADMANLLNEKGYTKVVGPL